MYLHGFSGSQTINIIMTKTFKQYFFENEQVNRLEDLLDGIQMTISTADHRHVERLKQQIGELYDQVIQAGRALPDHMQGGAAEPPKHIKTMRDLSRLVQASVDTGTPLPGETQQQILHLSNLFTEGDESPFPEKWRHNFDTTVNPFLKPRWAREQDKREAEKQKNAVMSAFSPLKTTPKDDIPKTKPTLAGFSGKPLKPGPERSKMSKPLVIKPLTKDHDRSVASFHQK